MSINQLVNSALARRPDYRPDALPEGLAGIASAANTPPVPIPAAGAPPAPPGQDASGVDTALHVLFGYIPVEVLTLYVAVLAAMGGPEKLHGGNVPRAVWATFWIFLCITPIVKWLVFGAKLIGDHKPVPWHPRTWPVWEMAAATVAYSAWAFALPNSPFTDYSWYSSGLAAVAVLAASTGLGLLAPFFQRPLAT
jgi:hypothetical protein